jgi:hypothetical protein
VAEYQGGALYRLDDIGHCEGFARTRYAQQSLFAVMALQAFEQFLDGFGLVAGGLVFTA